jgi:SAM-dependent methyltransferase
MEDKTIHNCPLCFSGTFSKLYEVKAENAPRLILTSNNSYRKEELENIIRSIWNVPKAIVVKCSKCSLVFSIPFIAGNSIYYDIAYGNSIYYPEWKWDFEKTLQVLTAIGKNETRNKFLLEIGAGDGAFLNRISNSLFEKKKITCTELSSYGCEEIRRNGIECIHDNWTVLDKPTYYSRFSIVCLFQVLEHLDNLHYFFNLIDRITTNDAHLFITVPNDVHRHFYDSIGVNYDVPPTHISRWNKSSFSFLAERFNWILVEHENQNQKKIRSLRRYLLTEFEQLSLKKYFRNKLLKTLVIIILSMINLKNVIFILRNPLGVAQWIHLRKSDK